jgi:hypothetical protein
LLDIEECVQLEMLSVSVPPLRFTAVTRAEDDLRAVGKGEFDLDDGIVATFFATEPRRRFLPRHD